MPKIDIIHIWSNFHAFTKQTNGYLRANTKKVEPIIMDLSFKSFILYAQFLSLCMNDFVLSKDEIICLLQIIKIWIYFEIFVHFRRKIKEDSY